MTEEEIYECSESIARGDSCLVCGAEWENHELIHATTCAYWRALDD